MEQHAIPRQITSFEFKLIGFLTIKQFIYLVIFIPAGILIFYTFPVPILNFFLGLVVGLIGVAFAFIPINDRPMEVWVRNLIKRLSSPTQYFFKKQNPAIYFLKDLIFTNDPHRVMSHIDSQQKLSKYISTQTPVNSQNRKQEISNLFTDSFSSLLGKKNNRQPSTIKDQSSIINHQSSILLNDFLSKWPLLLTEVRKKNHGIVTLLSLCRPVETEGSAVIVETTYKFHMEQLKLDRFSQIIEQTAKDIYGTPIQLRYRLAAKTAETLKNNSLDDNIVAVEEDLSVLAEDMFLS